MYVYVLNINGKPLMPTTRCGHIRILLKTQKAKVVGVEPFTVQLLYEVDNKTQGLCLGIDPGRTVNITEKQITILTCMVTNILPTNVRLLQTTRDYALYDFVRIRTKI